MFTWPIFTTQSSPEQVFCFFFPCREALWGRFSPLGKEVSTWPTETGWAEMSYASREWGNARSNLGPHPRTTCATLGSEKRQSTGFDVCVSGDGGCCGRVVVRPV